MSAQQAFTVTSSRINRLSTRAVFDVIRVIRSDTEYLDNRLTGFGRGIRNSGGKNYVVAMRWSEPTIAGSGKAVPLQNLVSTSI